MSARRSRNLARSLPLGTSRRYKAFMLFRKNPVIPFPRPIPLYPRFMALAGHSSTLIRLLLEDTPNHRWCIPRSNPPRRRTCRFSSSSISKPRSLLRPCTALTAGPASRTPPQRRIFLSRQCLLTAGHNRTSTTKPRTGSQLSLFPRTPIPANLPSLEAGSEGSRAPVRTASAGWTRARMEMALWGRSNMSAIFQIVARFMARPPTWEPTYAGTPVKGHSSATGSSVASASLAPTSCRDTGGPTPGKNALPAQNVQSDSWGAITWRSIRKRTTEQRTRYTMMLFLPQKGMGLARCNQQMKNWKPWTWPQWRDQKANPKNHYPLHHIISLRHRQSN